MKATPAARRETIAVLSTAHITEEVAAQLESPNPPDWAKTLYGWPPREYGFLFPVRKLDCEHTLAAHDQLPECLRQCFDLARADGADWLMLDRDECEIPELPTYDW